MFLTTAIAICAHALIAAYANVKNYLFQRNLEVVLTYRPSIMADTPFVLLLGFIAESVGVSWMLVAPLLATHVVARAIAVRQWVVTNGKWAEESLAALIATWSVVAGLCICISVVILMRLLTNF